MWRKITAFVVLISVLFAAKVSEYNDKYFEITKNLEIFANIYKDLNKFYVDELDPAELMRTGIDAMMHSLDPYTVYYSENQIERYRFMTEGKYDGIGAQVETIDDFITITQVYKNYAADEAGLKAGDRIIAVEGRSIEGMNTEEVNLMMRGVTGTGLKVTIDRPGSEVPIEVTLDREEVNVPNVPHYEMVDEQVGYVNLTTFTQRAGSNIANAIKELKKDHPEMDRVILDLRHNGGGLLSEAVNLCNLFIPQGELVVSTRSKVRDWDRTFKTRNPVLFEDMPLVVLVDERSASASEIVSGVIQDYDRGVIMGQKTFGKGLVQNTREVGYNSRIKLTTSKYYIPSGRCIQSVAYEDGEPVDIPDSLRAVFTTRNGRKVLDGGGVHPDVTLENEEESELVKTLQKQHLIFKYVNGYTQKLGEDLEWENYHFDEFDAFVDWLDSKEINFKYSSEKELDELEKAAKEQAYYNEIKDEIASARKDIRLQREKDLSQYEAIITALIEEEIISRYGYEEGRIQRRLDFDPEIKSAIRLLKDDKAYQKILQG